MLEQFARGVTVPGVLGRGPMRQRDPSEIVGKRDPDAEDAAAVDAAFVEQFGQHLADIADDHFGKREGDLARLPAADAAREVQRDQRDMIAVDVEPDRKGPVGVDDDPDRTSVVEGKSVSVRVDPGGLRVIKKRKTKTIKETVSDHNIN